MSLIADIGPVIARMHERLAMIAYATGQIDSESYIEEITGEPFRHAQRDTNQEALGELKDDLARLQELIEQ